MTDARRLEPGQAAAAGGVWTMPSIDPRQLLSGEEASAFLIQLGIQLKPKTLANLRCVGGGPVFFRLRNGKVAYSSIDLQEFVRLQLCFRGDSTSNLKPVA
jgi:hypothetical protein